MPHGAAMSGLVLYGAIILSFMGGAQWGLLMVTGGSTMRTRLAISVLPALAAFGLWFLPAIPALLGLAAVFVALLLYEIATARESAAPTWSSCPADQRRRHLPATRLAHREPVIRAHSFVLTKYRITNRGAADHEESRDLPGHRHRYSACDPARPRHVWLSLEVPPRLNDTSVSGTSLFLMIASPSV